MIKFVFLLMLSVLSGCVAMQQDFGSSGRNYNKLKLHLLTIGDDKARVEELIGTPVNVIGSKRFEFGIVEVWAYEEWRAALGVDSKDSEYWVYFLNGKLEQWGRPGDWAKEADRIYEIRNR